MLPPLPSCDIFFRDDLNIEIIKKQHGELRTYKEWYLYRDGLTIGKV